MILTKQAKGQLVGNGLADATGARAQELLDAYSVNDRRGMCVAPGSVPTASPPPCYIDQVFNRKA
jgi:hypothetical protein